MYSRDNSSDAFPECRINSAVRSRSHGDLHFYNSNSSSFEDNSSDYREPAHYVPQVPCRNSNYRFVDNSWMIQPEASKPFKSRMNGGFDLEYHKHVYNDGRDGTEDNNDGGVYHGYDSECSGAETEVFISDSPFDWSFSQDNDMDPYVSCATAEMPYNEYSDNDFNMYPQVCDITKNTLPILERISPEGPPRKPITRPRKLVRAKTEGSLLDCINKDERRNLSASNCALQSNTLPRGSSIKQKKVPRDAPQSILHKSSPKLSEIIIPRSMNLMEMCSKADQSNDPNAIVTRSVPIDHSDLPDQSTYIYKTQKHPCEAIAHDKFCAHEDNRKYSAENSIETISYPDTACYETGSWIGISRRPHGGSHFQEDLHTGNPVECSFTVLDDRHTTALLPHSLHFPNNTCACHPSHRQFNHCMDRNAHPLDIRDHHFLRMPIPSRAMFDGFTAPLPEIQINNTRIRPSSSVSINEQPQYFEFDANSPPNKEYRVNADVDPSSNPASEFSQRMTGYGASGMGGSSKRGTFARSLSTGEVPETEKTGGFVFDSVFLLLQLLASV